MLIKKDLGDLSNEGVFMREYFEDVEWKKVLIATPVFLAVVGVLVYFVVRPGETESEELAVDDNIEVSDEVFAEVQPIAQNAVSTAGNFGFNSVNVINANSFVEVNKTIVDSPEAVDPSMYRSRESAYNDVKEQFIYPGSPVDYSVSTVVSWGEGIEFSAINRYFKAENVVAEKPETMRKMELNGEFLDYISVDVNFDGVAQIADKESHGTNWDGTYVIKERDFDNQTVNVRLVKTGEGWKVYDMSMTNNRFLLSTWENPEQGIYTNELNTGYEEVDRMKTNIEIPPTPAE